ATRVSARGRRSRGLGSSQQPESRTWSLASSQESLPRWRQPVTRSARGRTFIIFSAASALLREAAVLGIHEGAVTLVPSGRADGGPTEIAAFRASGIRLGRPAAPRLRVHGATGKTVDRLDDAQSRVGLGGLG